ncbi:hypothetical protein Lgra_0272 [Legionella gratiana]|uniref:Uncharacterized protein n=1 Tax=Legionella gratiana TaxID=45066 RepID=A0A378JB32_9GAMM|nr:hypothetical protein [Legionella gratiana]KTD15606.1 hypothetical protein Lgra_0272 [Legionella gratiana]STX44992.1 Uncharacterised protein [Legionella gratiana]
MSCHFECQILSDSQDSIAALPQARTIGVLSCFKTLDPADKPRDVVRDVIKRQR